MITKEQAKQEATHTDEYGNLYKSLTETPSPYCVYYWHRSGQWFQDLGKDFSHLIPLKKAKPVVQCKAPCGTIGDFLYSHKDDNGYVLVSPIFSSYVELANWAKVNGWKPTGGLNGWYEKE